MLQLAVSKSTHKLASKLPSYPPLNKILQKYPPHHGRRIAILVGTGETGDNITVQNHIYSKINGEKQYEILKSEKSQDFDPQVTPGIHISISHGFRSRQTDR